MFKKDVSVPHSRPPVRLPSVPSMGEIGQIFSEAMRQAGTKLSLSWPNADKTSELLLSVLIGGSAGEAEWEFFQGSAQGNVLLWSYVTSDIMLVSNLISSSMDSMARQSVGTGKRSKEPDRYMELYQIPDAYYTAPLDRVEAEQQKQAAAAAASAGNRAPARNEGVLAGDLAQVDVLQILQSINRSAMTGRLRIASPSGDGEVFFQDGTPVHATRGALKGDESLLSMMIYQQGQYRFEPDAQADKRSVRQPFDTLLLKGVLLRDKAQYLFNRGLKPETIIARKHQNLAETEFERVSTSVASGSYLSFTMMAQKEFYLATDNNSNVSQLAEKLRLTESQWIPLLCRMLKCDFVELVNRGGEQIVRAERKVLDRHAIDSVMTSLRRPETGMYTYPAFLYFLEQEHIKHYRSRKPLSLVLVEARISGGDFEQRSPLPASVLGEFVRRISTLKRDVDILAHYEVFDAAVILPETSQNGAAIFASRLAEALSNPPLSTNAETQMSITIGTASMPEQVPDIEMLLGAADAAKNMAQRKPGGVMSYAEIASQMPSV